MRADVICGYNFTMATYLLAADFDSGVLDYFVISAASPDAAGAAWLALGAAGLDSTGSVSADLDGDRGVWLAAVAADAGLVGVPARFLGLVDLDAAVARVWVLGSPA